MLKVFQKYFPIRNLLFFLVEATLIILGILTAFVMLQGTGHEESMETSIGLRIGVIALLLQVNLYYLDLYDFSFPRKLIDMGLRLIQAIGATCLILAAVYLVFPQIILEEKIFFLGLVFLFVFLICWRVMYQTLCQNKVLTEPIFLVGQGSLASTISEHIRRNLDSGFTIAGLFDPAGRDTLARDLDVPAYRDVKQLCDTAKDHGIKKIVIALEERRGAFPQQTLLQCRMQGIAVYEGIQFFELLSGRILATETPPSWLIFSEGFNRHVATLSAKRALDVFAAGTGLILAAPLMGLIAVAVKASSPGPVFFRQVRVGQWEQGFEVMKFRTMRTDAEELTGAMWAEKEDPRITRVGRILRRFRLDELPQFLNVLKGEMSFVGPRPERPCFVEQLKQRLPYYGERHTVKPGITGWAQVNYGYGASEEDALRKLEYDLFYIKQLSLFFDLFIVLKTIKTVLFSSGAR